MNTEVYIMVVDKDSYTRESVGNIFRRQGYRVTTLDNGDSALKLIAERHWTIVLVDSHVEDEQRAELIKKASNFDPKIPVVFLCEAKDAEKGVRALEQGASDYVFKPISTVELLSKAARIIERHVFLEEQERLKKRIDDIQERDTIFSRSPSMAELTNKINQAAVSDQPVMILGEPGTGKELVAKVIHATGTRRYKPFVMAAFGAMQPELVESELFGHEKGAFTGAVFTKTGRIETSSTGTLVLDEVGLMPSKTQLAVALLLNEKSFRRVGGTQLVKFDSRVISTSSFEPEKLIESKQMREDLVKKLDTIRIVVPPLRERKEDIPVLAELFLSRYTAKTNKRVKRIGAAAMDMLMAYAWPYNIRELKNAVERSIMRSMDEEIGPDDLPFVLRGYLDDSSSKSIKEWEKMHIRRVLVENDWNISKTAKSLKIDRVTLYNKIKKYKIAKS